MNSALFLEGALGALGVAIVMIVVAVFPARPAQRGVEGAVAAIERRYTRGDEVEKRVDPFAALPGWLRQLALRLSPSGVTETLQRRLDLAGNPGRWTPDRILAAKGLLMLVLAAFGALYGLHSTGLLIFGAAAGGTLGFFLPDILLYNAAKKRQAQIQAALPDALDMLTVCVEAGLGFDAALGRVARNTSGPLAAEFARSLQEMQIGQSRPAALRGVVDRTTVPELRAFISAVIQASELGIPVGQVLREQSREMRLRRRQRAEEKAQKVPVKMMVPLIFCLLPALFVAAIGAGVITIAHTFFGPHGYLG